MGKHLSTQDPIRGGVQRASLMLFLELDYPFLDISALRMCTSISLLYKCFLLTYFQTSTRDEEMQEGLKLIIMGINL